MQHNDPNPYLMEREEFMRRELLSFARKLVICTLAGLAFAAFFALTGWGY